MNAGISHRRRFFVPEVIQTSAMDCGPAVLKCLLEGFGIQAHYGRLREACQTDVDGTSIDTLEEIAGQMGLAAEQVMLPVNYLLLPEAEALPAILIVRLPSGLTHFVLVWRRLGPFVQVMDPALGRRWLRSSRLLEEVGVHNQAVAAQAWRDWVVSEGLQPLGRCLCDLGLGRAAAGLIATAAAAPGWRSLARLDAAARFAAALVSSGGLRRGREVRRFLQSLRGQAPAGEPDKGLAIPEAFWSVQPAPPAADGKEQVLLRGAVLVRVLGRKRGGVSAPLGPELAAALAQPASRPARELFRLVRGQGFLSFLTLAVGLVLVAGSAVLEAVLFRAVTDLGHDLRLVEQRLQAAGCFLLLVGAVLLLEGRVTAGLLRLGRRLEVRLRQAFLEKIPRLNDRYFQSRPTSDMAERSHALHQVRLLPRAAGQFARAALTLLLTVAAIAWFDPAGAPLAALAAAAALGLPLAFLSLLQGLDLRVRTHVGALGRFYLDALLGLATVRAHGAERVVRREHESLLVEWALASVRVVRWVVVIEGLQLAVGYALAGWLLLLHAGQATDAAGLLLLAYWTLNLPLLGEEIALLTRQYPTFRNVTLRLLEPLGALEEGRTPEAAGPGKTVGESPGDSSPPWTSKLHPSGSVGVTFEAVSVRASGHAILQDVDLHIEAGSHVAIVGASGAGKSSLVGLLLGWHRAAAGRVLIDGEPLDAPRLDRLRGETAWVDPTVRLWNRSLADNLAYGTGDTAPLALGGVLAAAELYEVLQRLPDGLQTPLGEGGGCLSGGEGQRVRLGRSLLRSQARLVILDEPFRGLDRARRRELLRRARLLWRHATLLCITHDVGETRDFGRVLVIGEGRVLEDGPGPLLAADPASRYRALLDAEDAVRAGLWSGDVWRRLRLEEGRLREEEP
jgi:ATP-binding cassette subfamily B protein